MVQMMRKLEQNERKIEKGWPHGILQIMSIIVLVFPLVAKGTTSDTNHLSTIEQTIQEIVSLSTQEGSLLDLITENSKQGITYVKQQDKVMTLLDFAKYLMHYHAMSTMSYTNVADYTNEYLEVYSKAFNLCSQLGKENIYEYATSNSLWLSEQTQAVSKVCFPVIYDIITFQGDINDARTVIFQDIDAVAQKILDKGKKYLSNSFLNNVIAQSQTMFEKYNYTNLAQSLGFTYSETYYFTYRADVEAFTNLQIYVKDHLGITLTLP
ncbi:hypothetical protein [Psittacicella hinzii]|uniref:Uncharacterized protein n=2 Tax=Psittacicella hinzii TaxID=2028575 RepID=A0A3A1YAQ4_9GAMM|nr:hypothetical protein [Psittacicella hinzii]RIY35222.1 hypothetical protein CKF58_06890 [Psittacicella hinzii]